MRKFGKIFAILASLCLLVAAFAIVSSATTEPAEPFIVNGEAKATWADAVSAALAAQTAGNDATIYLAKNYTVTADDVSASTATLPYLAKGSNMGWKGMAGMTTASYAIAFDVALDTADTAIRVDLNGKTLTQDFDGALFGVTKGTLEVVGNGKIVNARTAFYTSSVNATLKMDMTGAGLDIKNIARTDTQVGCFPVFLLVNESSASFTGYFEVTPAEKSTTIFALGMTYDTSSNADAKNVKFSYAKVLVNPAVDTTTPAENDLNNMFWTRANKPDNPTVITIENSHLEIDTRMLVNPLKNTSGLTSSIKTYMTGNLPVIDETVFDGGDTETAYKNMFSSVNYALQITATNSSIIVNGKSHQGLNIASMGSILHLPDPTTVKASFTNCELVGGNVVFNYKTNAASNVAVDSRQIATSDVRFKDCNFTRNGNNGYGTAKSTLFFNGFNALWEGGVIDNGTYYLAIQCYDYHELNDNKFFGIKFSNVVTTGTKSKGIPATENFTPGSTWLYYYSHDTLTQDGINVLLNDKLVKVYCYGTTQYSDAAYKINTTGTNFTGATGAPSGATLESVTDANGNTYSKLNLAGTSSGNHDMLLASANSSSADYISWTQNKYVVSEFDISTDTFLKNRVYFKLMGYTGSGGYDDAFQFIMDSGTVNCSWQEQKAYAINKGEWTRVSFVFELNPVSDGQGNIDFSASRVHIYLNGELYTTRAWIKSANNVLTESVAAGTYFYAWRISYGYTGAPDYTGQSLCIDNRYVAAYPADYTLPEGKTVADLINNMPLNNYTPAGKVDGVEYENESELVENIKDGSIVELNKDMTTALDLNGKAVTFKLNGNTIPAVVSATHRLADYTGMDAVRTITANPDEIFNIGFAYGEANDTVTAAVGTTVVVPETMKPELFASVKNGDFYEKLTAWTTVDGTETLIVPEKGLSSAIPVVEKAAPVVVKWLEGGVEASSKEYNPFVTNTLTVPEISNARKEAVELVADSGWSKWHAIWNASELSAAELAINTVSETPVEVNVNDDKEKVAHVSFKLNLTLYADYKLNFYLPTYNTAEAGVTNVKLATVVDGTTTVAVYNTCTIGGSAFTYDNYRFTFGVADTTIQDYWIIYTLGGTEYKYHVTYGVPYYAYQVMDEFKDSDDETDSNALMAKNLIMNLVNYADKVMTVQGADKTTEGAKIYNDILTNADYAKYLDYYNNSLGDEKFTSGDIFQTEIENLTADKIAEGAKNMISGYSFYFNGSQPCLVFKYSDEAVQAGIHQPSNSKGEISYGNATVNVTSSFKFDNTSALPGRHIAFKLTTDENGDVVKREQLAYNDAGAWVDGKSVYIAPAPNSFYYEYCFYAFSDYYRDNPSSWATTAKMWNMTETLTFTVYDSVYVDAVIDEETGKCQTGTNCNKTEAHQHISEVVVGEYHYNMASYINSLVTSSERDNDAVNAAKAFYAFSKMAKAYLGK